MCLYTSLNDKIHLITHVFMCLLVDFDRDNQLGKQDIVNTITYLTRNEMTYDEIQFIVGKVRVREGSGREGGREGSGRETVGWMEGGQWEGSSSVEGRDSWKGIH